MKYHNAKTNSVIEIPDTQSAPEGYVSISDKDAVALQSQADKFEQEVFNRGAAEQKSKSSDSRAALVSAGFTPAQAAAIIKVVSG